jgi:hypothetical protein
LAHQVVVVRAKAEEFVARPARKLASTSDLDGLKNSTDPKAPELLNLLLQHRNEWEQQFEEAKRRLTVSDAELAPIAAERVDAHYEFIRQLFDCLLSEFAAEEAHAVKRAAQEAAWAHHVREEEEKWRTRGVVWAPFPRVLFLDELPDGLEHAWQHLLNLPAKALTFEYYAAALKKGRRDPCLLSAALNTVVAYLEMGHWPKRDPNRITPGDVLRAVQRYRGLDLVNPPPARSPKERKATQRQREREKVEAIFGGACRACGRSRDGGVRRFDLHHLAGDGGGFHREAPTDKLRRQVLAYHAEHGEAPQELELLCHPCHQHQTRAQRVGSPWGDRIDTRTGDLYDGEDWPDGLPYTTPQPAPRRHQVPQGESQEAHAVTLSGSTP